MIKLFLIGNEFDFGKYFFCCDGSELEKKISFSSVEWLTHDFICVMFGPFLFHCKIMFFFVRFNFSFVNFMFSLVNFMFSLLKIFLVFNIFTLNFFALKLSSNVVSCFYFFGFGLCIFIYDFSFSSTLVRVVLDIFWTPFCKI